MKNLITIRRTEWWKDLSQ